MAKRAEKGKGKEAAGGPADALREAVERTFQGAAGGAAATRERAGELLEEVTSAVQRLRDARLVETLESLRDELQTLARRVAALERRAGGGESAGKPATPAKGAKSAKSATAAAARKTGTAAKRGTSTGRAKAAAKKTGATKKPAAAKPGASKPAATKKARTSTRAGTRATKPGARRSS